MLLNNKPVAVAESKLGPSLPTTVDRIAGPVVMVVFIAELTLPFDVDIAVVLRFKPEVIVLVRRVVFVFPTNVDKVFKLEFALNSVEDTLSVPDIVVVFSMMSVTALSDRVVDIVSIPAPRDRVVKLEPVLRIGEDIVLVPDIVVILVFDPALSMIEVTVLVSDIIVLFELYSALSIGKVGVLPRNIVVV